MSESKWMPIETAPKDGTPIIAFFPYDPDLPIFPEHQAVICWATWDNWAIHQEYLNDNTGDVGDLTPTHWQPLLKRPEAS